VLKITCKCKPSTASVNQTFVNAFVRTFFIRYFVVAESEHVKNNTVFRIQTGGKMRGKLTALFS